MKIRKIALFTLALITTASTAFYSCKKEQLTNNTQRPNASVLASFSGDVTVNSDGYLIFTTTEDFALFSDFCAVNTHGDVATYLNSIGFTSYASEEGLYDAIQNDPVTEAQAINYVLSADKIVQVDDVLIKPISNDEFLLAMTSSNKNSTSYADMVNSSYNSSYMNKFATFGPIDAEDSDMLTFMATTPFGFEETAPNTPPPTFRLFGRDNFRESNQIYKPNGELMYVECWWDVKFFGFKIGENHREGPCD